MSKLIRIALTAGEPAGIGPDLCVKLAQTEQTAQVIAIGDPQLLAQRAVELGLPLTLTAFDDSFSAPSAKGELFYQPIMTSVPAESGVLNPGNAQYVLDTLTHAAEGCLSQQYDAIVTAPVHKGVINEAGIPFTGHTEFFAEHANIQKVVMMLATPTLRVALVTTHLPLRAVSDAITTEELEQTLDIIYQTFTQQFNLKNPRIAVCGLNPHAGEGGHLGFEEIDVITPVIERCQERGWIVTGPWPADTIFVKDRLEDYDVVLAMYHDQGLPVLKHQGFGDAVNITLGLPYIRTSVDHGTALDLAGTGKAHAGSLLAALNMAITIAEQTK